MNQRWKRPPHFRELAFAELLEVYVGIAVQHVKQRRHYHWDGQALKPIRQAVRQHFGEFARHVAHGLSVRRDHDSQNVSDAFQSELRFLGIESSPAYGRAPEGNGCAERFIPTLKGNPLWVDTRWPAFVPMNAWRPSGDPIEHRNNRDGRQAAVI